MVPQRRFTLGSIDVFTTWQGSVVCTVRIGLSLLMINRQQQNLALLTARALSRYSLTCMDLIRLRICRVIIISSKPCGSWKWLADGTAGSAHVAIDAATTVAIPLWWG